MCYAFVAYFAEGFFYMVLEVILIALKQGDERIDGPGIGNIAQRFYRSRLNVLVFIGQKRHQNRRGTLIAYLSDGFNGPEPGVFAGAFEYLI